MAPLTVPHKLTPKQMRKAKADAYYRMNVDLTRDLKKGLQEVDVKNLEGTLNSYLALMNPPEDAQETMEVQTEVLRQMSLFAVKTLTHILVERLRGK